MALVTVPECCFSTPRIIMQKCCASAITPTPSGSSISWMALGNLLRQPLLNLQPPREDIDDSRHLAQPDYLVPRQIGHVHFAVERQHVVLAEAEELDILDDHHLVVLHVDRSRR